MRHDGRTLDHLRQEVSILGGLLTTLLEPTGPPLPSPCELLIQPTAGELVSLEVCGKLRSLGQFGRGLGSPRLASSDTDGSPKTPDRKETTSKSGLLLPGTGTAESPAQTPIAKVSRQPAVQICSALRFRTWRRMTVPPFC